MRFILKLEKFIPRSKCQYNRSGRSRDDGIKKFSATIARNRLSNTFFHFLLFSHRSRRVRKNGK